MNEIKILIADGCTKLEAEKFIKRGTTIFTEQDFEENFESYMSEWGVDEEDKEAYKKMVETKNPVTDWGVVEYEGKTYYIMYVN